MKSNRFYALFFLIALVAAIGLTTQSASGQQTQPSPLVTQTDSDGSNPQTVWKLVLPEEPGEKVRLSRQRMEYGLSILQLEDGPKLREFMQAFIKEVQPPNAWQKAEALVIRFTGGRAETGTLPIADVRLSPSQIHIINTPEELLSNFSLRPEEMNPIIWSKDPVGPCKITKRTDLLNNISNIEAQIDHVHADDPVAATASKQALRSCIAQSGDSPTCNDRYVRDLMYIQRNRGSNSTGVNEAYDPKTTNVPNARATVYWNDYLKTFEGVGWECCGNPLAFYTNTVFVAGLKTALQTPQTLACQISPGEYVFRSRADSANFNLTITPAQKPEDVSIDWFRGATLAARNTFQLGVSGADVEPNFWISIQARVAVGKKEVRCDARVSLQFEATPTPTPIVQKLVPKPATVCTEIENSENYSVLSHGRGVQVRPVLNPSNGRIHDVKWNADQTVFATSEQAELTANALRHEKGKPGKPSEGSHAVAMTALNELNQPVACGDEFSLRNGWSTKKKVWTAVGVGSAITGAVLCAKGIICPGGGGNKTGGPGQTPNPPIKVGGPGPTPNPPNPGGR